jgi:hypothetical protein
MTSAASGAAASAHVVDRCIDIDNIQARNLDDLQTPGAGRSFPQNLAVTVSRAVSGSTGCSTLSMTPFRQTAVGGGVGELQAANRLSVLISDPYA